MYSANEGDLYKIVNLGGRTFELRFGYYEEYERESTVSHKNPLTNPINCVKIKLCKSK